MTGLDPNSHYCLYIAFDLAAKCRYKYSNSSGWQPAGIEETQSNHKVYLHPNSPQTGKHWMSSSVGFKNLKITNSPIPKPDVIILNSMHKYIPRLIIAKTTNVTDTRASFVAFSFPETKFIAVTAYQNPSITQLKIDNNKFAKGFRTSGKANTKRKIAMENENPKCAKLDLKESSDGLDRRGSVFKEIELNGRQNESNKVPSELNKLRGEANKVQYKSDNLQYNLDKLQYKLDKSQYKLDESQYELQNESDQLQEKCDRYPNESKSNNESNNNDSSTVDTNKLKNTSYVEGKEHKTFEDKNEETNDEETIDDNKNNIENIGIKRIISDVNESGIEQTETKSENNQTENKQIEIKQNETKQTETKQTETKQTEIKQSEAKQNQTNQRIRLEKHTRDNLTDDKLYKEQERCNSAHSLHSNTSSTSSRSSIGYPPYPLHPNTLYQQHLLNQEYPFGYDKTIFGRYQAYNQTYNQSYNGSQSYNRNQSLNGYNGNHAYHGNPAFNPMNPFLYHRNQLVQQNIFMNYDRHPFHPAYYTYCHPALSGFPRDQGFLNYFAFPHLKTTESNTKQSDNSDTSNDDSSDECPKKEEDEEIIVVDTPNKSKRLSDFSIESIISN